MVDWKHPEMAVEVAKRLDDNNIDYTMTIIGEGTEFPKIKELVKKHDLQSKVTLLGALPPNKVREYMEKSEIFIFTSDRNEGWGAVLNEAMNSCCAVVANLEIGAVPFLISDGFNGLIYLDGDKFDLYKKVESLLVNDDVRKQLSVSAYNTMKSIWNGDNAAEALLRLIKSFQDKCGDLVPKEGPCSRADILKDNWYRKGERNV